MGFDTQISLCYREVTSPMGSAALFDFSFDVTFSKSLSVHGFVFLSLEVFSQLK